MPSGAAENVTWDSIKNSYDPMVDTMALKSDPDAFESLRNNYDYRPEVV